MQKPIRRAIVVVGMHRSGTSALTRMMSLLGAALPSVLAQPDPSTKETNELGFWEGAQINDINDSFLKAIGSDWNSTSRIDEAAFRSDAALLARSRIVAHLEAEFAGAPLFVIKDPRIARVAPLWVDALRTFGAEPNFVVAIRNPLEVASSLLKRNGMGRGVATLLWLRYMLDAERYTRNFRRCFVSYDSVLDNWRREARRISADCGFEWPRFNAGSEMEVDYFLSADRRHNVASRDAAQELPGWIWETYVALEEASRESVFDVGTADRVLSQLDVADATYDRVVREFDFGMRDHASRREQASEALASLESRTGQAETRAAGAEAERDRLAAEIAALSIHWQSVADDFARTRDELAAARNASAAGESRLEALSAELGASRETIESARAERDEAGRRHLAAEQALDSVRAEYERLTQEYRLKTEAWQAVAYERDKARRELSDTARELFEMRERHALLLTDQESNEKRLAAAESALAETQRAGEAAGGDLAELRAKVLEARKQAEAEIERLRGALDEHQASVEALRAELAGRTEQVEQAIVDRNDARNEQEALEGALALLLTEKERLEAELRVLIKTQAVESSVATQDRLRGLALEGELGARDSAIARLVADLSSATGEVDAARAEASVLSETLAEATAARHRAERERAELAKQLGRVRVEHRKQEGALAAANERASHAQARMAELEAGANELSRDLAELARDRDDARRSYDAERARLSTELAERASTISELDAAAAKLSGDLTRRSQVIADLEAKLHRQERVAQAVPVLRRKLDELHDRSDRETQRIADLDRQLRFIQDESSYQARRAQISTASVAAARVALAAAHREIAARDAQIATLIAAAAAEHRPVEPETAPALEVDTAVSSLHADAADAEAPIEGEVSDRLPRTPPRWLAALRRLGSQR